MTTYYAYPELVYAYLIVHISLVLLIAFAASWGARRWWEKRGMTKGYTLERRKRALGLPVLAFSALYFAFLSHGVITRDGGLPEFMFWAPFVSIIRAGLILVFALVWAELAWVYGWRKGGTLITIAAGAFAFAVIWVAIPRWWDAGWVYSVYTVDDSALVNSQGQALDVIFHRAAFRRYGYYLLGSLGLGVLWLALTGVGLDETRHEIRVRGSKRGFLLGLGLVLLYFGTLAVIGIDLAQGWLVTWREEWSLPITLPDGLGFDLGAWTDNFQMPDLSQIAIPTPYIETPDVVVPTPSIPGIEWPF